MSLLLALLTGCSSQREILFAAPPLADRDTLTIEIFAMRPDGSGLRQVTHNRAIYSESNFPSWSPDGSQIVYLATPRSYPAVRTSIHIMRADGTDDRILARFDSSDVAIPEWSPDGRHIAFSVDQDSASPPHNSIFTIARDGSSLTPVSLEPGAYSYPGWPPDDQSLLTARRLPAGGSVLLRIDPRTGASHVIASSEELIFEGPRMSPDRSTIVVQGAIMGPPLSVHVYTLRADGTDLRQLTTDSGVQNYPRWSSDGAYIIMQCNPADPNAPYPGLTWFATFEICIIKPNGGPLRQLTHDAFLEVHPSW